MFKHILVPVDGSNSSMLAVHKGVELAKAFGSTLTAVYVVDPYPFTGVGADFAYGQSQYLSAATAVAVHRARDQGRDLVALFTEGAERFFDGLGFRAVGRDALPDPIRESAQATEECAVSATPMMLDLRPAGSHRAGEALR